MGKLNETYDQIGIGYDSTRQADPYLSQRMFDLLHSGQPDGRYLDVGCGTGNYTAALYARGLDFIGIDPSREMLEKAQAKNPAITWIMGTAEQIDLPADSINGVLASLTIHHWQDLRRGFLEISRVLKKDGRMVLFTTLPEQTKAYWLYHYFPKMIEDSIKVLPRREQIEEAFDNAGLKIVQEEAYFVQPDLQDRFLYSGKHDPEMYFSAEVRKGISSFSLLANQAEVRQGLQQMRADIDHGKIQAVIEAHQNELGDYLFLIAEKS